MTKWVCKVCKTHCYFGRNTIFPPERCVYNPRGNDKIPDWGVMVINVYTIDEVATHLKIKPVTVRLWITQGKIKAFKLGDLVRVREDELQEFIVGASTNFRIVVNTEERDDK